MAIPIAALPSLRFAHCPFLGNVLSQSLSCPLPQRSPDSLDTYQPLGRGAAFLRENETLTISLF